MYIGDYLARRELYTPDKVGIIDAGKQPLLRLTYRQMNERANRLATWLRTQAGVGKGDRVAILSLDGIEHLDVFFACGKLGAIHTALNWRFHWREVAQILADTTPKVLVYGEEFLESVTSIVDEPGGTFTPGYFIHIGGNGVAGSRHYDSVMEESSMEPVTCETLGSEDIAALIFTGGTTGLPKGAQVSHRMIGWNTLNTVIHDLHHDDVYLNVFPMFHTGGLFVYTLPQVIMGGTTILVKKFEPPQVLSLLESEKVTVFAGVPTMYQMLTQAENWSEVDLAALRFCTSGGAPLPVPLVEQYTREKGIRFKQGFGMTEFGPGIFALAPEDAIRKAGSIGRPNFFVDARIIDEVGNFLGSNQVGELVLKGPSYSSGYFNNLSASEEAVDDKGYFHTGDLAKYDDEGYFFIVDRVKDMYISGGENVYPVEIELILYKHPAVLQCAVVGVPDQKWGEIGVACVVLKKGLSVTEGELISFMEQNLARYKVPKRVVLMDQLPISGAGKILKRELQQKMINQNFE